jgi:diguanylate cyclase (GGDEF)-like protein
MVVYLSVIIFPGELINQEPSIRYLLERLFPIIFLGAGLSLPALLVSRNYHFQRDSIRKLTVRDGLTGLNNRRFFNQIFQREINRARRDNKYLSLLMIDIDYFKHYNDKYGHEKGDEALISIGRLLMRLTTRGSDYVFRLAGEEFAVVFSDLDPEAARGFSEKIRSEIERLRIEHIRKSTGLFMSASLGLATIIPSEDMNMDWYYHLADQGLHQAKENGRNRVGVV